MEWKLEYQDQIKARVSSTEASSAKLLGDLLAMWSRDLQLQDWEDRKRMAWVAVEHSDLDDVEIWCIFQTDLEGLPDCGDPPWSFSHPLEDGSVTLYSEG